MNRRTLALPTLLLAGPALPGCGTGPNAGKPPAPATNVASATSPADDVAAERAALPPDERALVEAQEWCVVNTGERLGSMGPPLKLDLNGKPVYICCKGCQSKAERDPDKTLAKVEELKAKAKAERGTKG